MPSSAQQLLFLKLLAMAVERRASDIHFAPGQHPMLRIDGELTALQDEAIVSADQIPGLLKTFLTEAEYNRLQNDRQLIVAKTFERSFRFKIVMRYERDQLALSLRPVIQKIPTLAELGLPEFVQRYADLERGLVVIAGPFDSGKTTTLASFLQHINEREERYISTIEQPIEYIISPVRATVEQREIGRDVPTVLDALSLIEQEDVEVVAISEVPDPATREKMLLLTEAGRLTFLAVEAHTTIQALEQIIHHPSADQRKRLQDLLSESLVCVLLQRLVRRVGGGRVLATEILVGTTAVKALVREGRLFQIHTVVQTSRTEGMIPLDNALVQLVKTGVALPEEIMRHAQDPEQVRTLLRR